MTADQPTRTALLDAIRSRGGIHKSELARSVGIGWGNVGHHLRVLEEAGLVELEGRGKFLWVFDASLSREARDLLVATRPSTARRLLEFIGMSERATVGTLSHELALSKKVIRHHLGVLTKAGALERRPSHPPAFAPVKVPPRRPQD